MKILLHDYSGHPFQAQLSRALAARGHAVDHVHCASYVSGKGRLESRAADPSSLRFTALRVEGAFDKYSVPRRIRNEIAYARTFLGHVRATAPDLVVMCNVPLIAHAVIERRLRQRKVATVFWHQDVYSHAMGIEARRRLGRFGPAVANVLERLERGIARNARGVVAISDGFLAVHDRWDTPRDSLHVIPNWAPLDEVTPRSRDNRWSRAHDLTGVPVLLYSGTLGLKHNPALLVELLRGVRRTLPDTRLVVVNEGPAANQLRDLDEPGLTVLPFQSVDDLPEVLASADILVTILNPEASGYSVPSKTLSYLCAGRPVVAMLPTANPAYAIVGEAGGMPVDLTQVEMAVAADQVAALLGDASDRGTRGRRAREYAEESFSIETLVQQFEQIFLTAAGKKSEPVDVPSGLRVDDDVQVDLTATVHS